MVVVDEENGPEEPKMEPAVVVTVVVPVVAPENSPVDAVVTGGDENKPVGTVDTGTDENKPPGAGAVDAAADENKPVLGAAAVENSPLVGVVETVAAVTGNAANKLPLDVVAAGTDENKPAVGAAEEGTDENSPTAGVVDGVETALDTVGVKETEVLDGGDTGVAELAGGASTGVEEVENKPVGLVVVVPEIVVALGKDVVEICGAANNVLEGTGELVGDLKSPAPTFLEVGVPNEIFPPPNAATIKVIIFKTFGNQIDRIHLT